jgi:decaprenyl-phosphate phosphoribosyltransferase
MAEQLGEALDALPVATAPRATPRRAASLLRAVRPRQWVKNGLVLAVPLAAGRIFEPRVLAATGIAFAAFTLTACGIYLINDVRDIEQDRLHPVKRLRPVAAGQVPVRLATWLGAALVLLGVLAALAGGAPLAAVVGGYAVAALAYCLGWKREPVVELGLIAAFFLLRASAGGVAAGLPISLWFLLVASFGSLFVAAGKRYGELRLMGEGTATTRRSLAHYSESYLRFVWGMAASVTVVCYGLWAFFIYGEKHLVWAPLSLAPFVLALLRYAMDVDRGAGGAPEEVLWRDRPLQILALAWAALLAAAVLT